MAKKLLGWAFLFLFILATSLQAQTSLLHSFAGGVADGALPYGSLILKGSMLYGMTYGGGAHDFGTIFKINKDGTGFMLLHSFAGGAVDGALPYGSLALKGSTLYGMTYRGGTYGIGTIFKINTNGTGFALLHSFAGGAMDGTFIAGSLILKGSTLYGMTRDGGASDAGTIFKINTNGTGFALLHSFAGGAADGKSPYGSLILKGSTLYGMTHNGGANDEGTIFKINTNGTGLALLHSFAGYPSDGANPLWASLILKGSTLYGMTHNGGAGDEGTIFKINTNGTGFALLHSFDYYLDGAYPYGSPILKGSTLCGMTYSGGSNHLGTIFEINKDSTGFILLHSFAAGAADGALPYGSLTLKGSTFYGMTYGGGASDLGVIFSYNLK